MVVTLDGKSSYQTPPTLRLFAQPMDLLPPPPAKIGGAGGGGSGGGGGGGGGDSKNGELRPEWVDPLAGQPTVGRDGRTVFVRPVDMLEPGMDLSGEEDPEAVDGLFETTRSAPVTGGSSTGSAAGRPAPSRVRRRDGERLGKYREVRGARLHAERGVTFWRFGLEVELTAAQARIAYRINRGPAVGFWVPARGQSMHVMFHSCNGFSLSVDPDQFCGPDPLWRDVLGTHQTRPFHVMVGGGDQIYMDAATKYTKDFRRWCENKSWKDKMDEPFSAEMQDELEEFYLERYAMWFSQGLFGMANGQIPMVNIWDDHDILDGFGSYPDNVMSCPVFTGVGAVAFKYYMLFQHQSLPTEGERDEPSWLLGAHRGPYIDELSRSVFMSFGGGVKFLGLDCRTERMHDEVLSQETYDRVFDRCRREVVKGETRHLIVLLGVPIAYPRLNFLENVLTSRIMDPIKALGRSGALGGFVNKFDGGVEILDDLNDHWTARHHKHERNWLIQELQELAADKSVRVTILSGDVHLAAVGQFYTNRALGVAKDRDHRYMPNIISSAIVNSPPPDMMADLINKRNKVHHLDDETDEDMIALFDQDVDGKKRNNTHLLPRRNWCAIREYIPGATPPPYSRSRSRSPSPYEAARPRRPSNSSRRPSITRSLSFGRRGSFSGMRPGNILRRLSRGGGGGGGDRRAEGPPVSYYNRDAAGHQQHQPPPPPPPGPFQRRPTISGTPGGGGGRKYFGGGGGDGAPSAAAARAPYVDLEHGLDVALNVEQDASDPTGITKPYRLLVPALRYDGPRDANPVARRSRGRWGGLLGRMRRRGLLDGKRDDEGEDGGGEAAGSESPSESEAETPAAAPRAGWRRGAEPSGAKPSRRDGRAGGYGEEAPPPPRAPPRRSERYGARAYEDESVGSATPPLPPLEKKRPGWMIWK
ncbi:hypothetical protein BDY21DRAFT_316398 [Lineolata rhizophorae]|uniref:PhoD-like phosphatase domain-containing protein n=1 Tax=Lineolata rhizophorae TaxID=578093 RepID=A0A6A6P7D5_9PEZI|nr:hypothetical protein BDY21DRAFT_316398 [Lineolata rhizophorae]